MCTTFHRHSLLYPIIFKRLITIGAFLTRKIQKYNPLSYGNIFFLVRMAPCRGETFFIAWKNWFRRVIFPIMLHAFRCQSQWRKPGECVSRMIRLQCYLFSMLNLHWRYLSARINMLRSLWSFSWSHGQCLFAALWVKIVYVIKKPSGFPFHRTNSYEHSSSIIYAFLFHIQKCMIFNWICHILSGYFTWPIVHWNVIVTLIISAAIAEKNDWV